LVSRTFIIIVRVVASRTSSHRSTPVVFIGYERGAKAWRFYDPASQCAVMSKDAIFDKPTSWSWEDEEIGAGENCCLEFHTIEFESEGRGVPERIVGTLVTSPAMSGPEPTTLAPTASPLPQPAFVSPPSNAEEYLDADDVEPRYRTVNNILGIASPPGLAACQLHAELHMPIVEEPTTFSEAERHQSWQQAMLEEIDSIESNQTWVRLLLALAAQVGGQCIIWT
jgi:hypothetical protein